MKTVLPWSWLINQVLWQQLNHRSAEDNSDSTKLQLSLAPAGTSLMTRIPILPVVMSSSVLRWGLLFHRLGLILHSRPTPSPPLLCRESCVCALKLKKTTKKKGANLKRSVSVGEKSLFPQKTFALKRRQINLSVCNLLNTSSS